MGICTVCGHDTWDGDSWKSAYLSVLQQNNTLVRSLRGWQRLAELAPLKRCESSRSYTLTFTDKDLVDTGLKMEELLR